MRLSFLELPGHERQLFFGSRGHITTPLALTRFACCPAMSACRSCVATQALKPLVDAVFLQERKGDTIISLAYDRKAAARKAARNRDGATRQLGLKSRVRYTSVNPAVAYPTMRRYSAQAATSSIGA